MNEPTALAVNTPASGTPRNHGINYLGNLGRVLRDLTGFTTLAFELLQNTDDADAGTTGQHRSGHARRLQRRGVLGLQRPGPYFWDCLYIPGRGHRSDFAASVMRPRRQARPSRYHQHVRDRFHRRLSGRGSRVVISGGRR